MNCFRTPEGTLDRTYLRTCAIWRLLKHGHISFDHAKALAARPIRRNYMRRNWLDNTIEIWKNGPLKHRAVS